MTHPPTSVPHYIHVLVRLVGPVGAVMAGGVNLCGGLAGRSCDHRWRVPKPGSTEGVGGWVWVGYVSAMLMRDEWFVRVKAAVDAVDPVGLLGLGAPDDEYDPEVEELAGWLRGGGPSGSAVRVG